MMRNVLRLGALTITAICFACAPMGQAPAPPVAPAIAPPPPPALSCTAGQFVTKIWTYNDPTFSPYPGANQPLNAMPLASSSAYAQSLIAAFNAAGRTGNSFAQQLCNLDRVYVNLTACAAPCASQSWGWVQSSNFIDTANKRGRIVALSAILFGSLKYSDFETVLTNALAPPFFTGTRFVGVQPQSADTPTTALLAALAHEIGHIGWNIVKPLTAGGCYANFFGDWYLPTNPPNDYRQFLDQNTRNILRGQPGAWNYSPWIDLIDLPQSGGHTDIYHSIWALLLDNGGESGVGSQRGSGNGFLWPSIFGAMSPDEQFVETYVLKVLTSIPTPLTKVPVIVPGYGAVDVVDDFLNSAPNSGKRPGLWANVHCLPAVFF